MTKRLANRILKLEEFAERRKPEDEDSFKHFVENLPDLWLDNLLNESTKLSNLPDIESYLLIVDTSASPNEKCQFQISLPGETDYQKFINNRFKKPKHFKAFLIDNAPPYF